MRGRDFAGAAKALAVVYHRFALFPAQCAQMSLEVVRRQSTSPDQVTQFLKVALEDTHLDRLLLLKELFLLHIQQAEFYEAYHLFKDEIQPQLNIENDARLLSSVGTLCYWLLLIECPELRDRFKQDDVAADFNVDDDELSMKLDSQSTDAMLERYMFKPPIGAHILFQEATSALRRAVWLCPRSSAFVEYYVQLLVLGGEVDRACDYLENFFHLNRDDPHATRMVRCPPSLYVTAGPSYSSRFCVVDAGQLARFLECYYPESTDAQVDVFKQYVPRLGAAGIPLRGTDTSRRRRWLKNDPSCRYALEKIVDFASGGAITSLELLRVLADAVDGCGGDCHAQLHLPTVVALWNRLARELVAIEEDDNSADPNERTLPATITELVVSRAWWKRVYFGSTDVLAVQQLSALGPPSHELVEMTIYRAAVACRLFPNECTVVNCVLQAAANPPAHWTREHTTLVRQYVKAPSIATIALPVLTNGMIVRRLIRAPEQAVSEKPATPALIFKAYYSPSTTVAKRDEEQAIVQPEVLLRSELISDSTGGYKMDIECESEDTRHQLETELASALEASLRAGEGADVRQPRVSRKRPFDMVSVGSHTQSLTIAVPLYVSMIEEAVYKHRKVKVRHLYTDIKAALAKSNIAMPTVMEVQLTLKFFQERLGSGTTSSMLLRYEAFLAQFVREHMRDKAIDWQISQEVVDAAVAAMRRGVPGTHVHFPSAEDVETMLKRKKAALIRLRRRLMREYEHAMRWVSDRFYFLVTGDLVAAAWAVCEHNGHDRTLVLDHMRRRAEIVLVRKYRSVYGRLRNRYRAFLADMHAREHSSDAVKVFKLLKKRYWRSSVTLATVQAYLWLEEYQHRFGAIPTILEEDRGAPEDVAIADGEELHHVDDENEVRTV
ncbi:TPA: hypothetical protein N0F65_003485 [Lagenidium giganteum]|uniref:Uncharacterized protein n=1 Tax=Lagenidium giganteum TaxID=4803 RepID=A0AAV2YFJ1_9STRA|nr:TPA: hypothetical protein N0F65_003485 [Lagenidium giganteum]